MLLYFCLDGHRDIMDQDDAFEKTNHNIYPSLRQSSGGYISLGTHLNILAVGLWDIGTLLLRLRPALLLGVIHGGAALRVLSPALLLVVCLLK